MFSLRNFYQAEIQCKCGVPFAQVSYFIGNFGPIPENNGLISVDSFIVVRRICIIPVTPGILCKIQKGLVVARSQNNVI